MEGKQKVVAILSAMEIELSYVEEFLKSREGWIKKENNKYINSERNLCVVTQILGIGKVNAASETMKVIINHQPDLLVNVGYAGGLVKEAQRGNIAIGTEYEQVDFIPYMEFQRPYIKKTPAAVVRLLRETAKELQFQTFEGKIATGDYFLHDAKQKESILKEFNPVAFDMESAAIAQVATNTDTNFVSIRIFSDLADEEAGEDIQEHTMQEESRIPIEQKPIVLIIHALERR